MWIGNTVSVDNHITFETSSKKSQPMVTHIRREREGQLMGIIYNMCSGLALVSGHAEDRGRRSDRRVKTAENGRVWRRNTVEGGLVWVFWVVYLRYRVYRWVGCFVVCTVRQCVYRPSSG